MIKELFGQPDSYSDMLQRIFVMSVVTGIICTLILSDASPALKGILDSVKTEADIGLIKGLKALYVLIPLLVALFSRVMKLHDRISDVFRIRYVFDTKFILYPLAEESGITLSDALKKKIAKDRNKMMYAVFYPYASFRDPKIDRQLVQTSADHWGWYWVFLESAFMFAVTAVILGVIGEYRHALLCMIIIVVELVFLLFLGFACRRNAQPQVDAILADRGRFNAISSEFQRL
jgi:hypothetical protein